LISNKIHEIKGLITFWKPGWYENMPTSPRYRVSEFANICLEYIKKPYYFIFGKEYVSTFKDYIGGFNMGYQSAFSREEFI
jgi:hypothetical protein